MPNDKIYTHELVEIAGHNTRKYMHHMTAVWSPVRREHKQICLGVWAEVGATGNWPRTVNIWELDGWEGLAFHLGFEASGKKSEQDSSLGKMEPKEEGWWKEATNFRRTGRDRALKPTPWTRTVDELLADGVRGAVYAHERVWTSVGRSWEYLDLVHDVALAAYGEHGIDNIGAYDNALINQRECFVLWAFPEWNVWAAFERAWRSDKALVDFRRRSGPMVERFERRLMTDSPLNPMVLGRQPHESDLPPQFL
jgi:hypothetical protein